jgi:hypothetical protein
VKNGFFVALTVAVALPVTAFAQAAQTPEPPAASQETTLRPAAPAPESRRHAIKLVEAVLSSAVRGGAEHLAEQLGSGSPNMSFFTGQARARGFVLDGYGVFFHVEIPEMQQSLVMSIATLERDMAVSETFDALRRAVSSVPESPSKLQAEQVLKRFEVLVGPAQTIADPASVARPSMLKAAADPSDLPPVAPMPMILRDPNTAYREAIKSALIDAMLEHSRGLNIQPDEWLTVAAQRGDSPLGPNEIVTSSTLVLRIKGSALAIYDADRTRKDEIRKRVEAREF